MEINSTQMTDFTASTRIPTDVWNSSAINESGTNVSKSTTVDVVGSGHISAEFGGTTTNMSFMASNSTGTSTNVSSWGTVGLMTTPSEAALNDAGIAAVFMTLFTLAALVGNICCLFALTRKSLEKTCILYSFLSNFCAVQLCDSVLTMPLITGAAFSGHWPYGIFMCQLSAFLLSLVNVETVIALALLSLDRLLLVRWPNFYGKMNRLKASPIIGYAWVHGTAFTLLIVAGVIPVAYLPNCYLCSVSSHTTHVYSILFSLFCFLFPLIIILALHSIIIKAVLVETTSTQNVDAEESYTNSLEPRCKHRPERRPVKVVGALVIFWIIFEGPYLALQTVYLFGHSGYPSTVDNIFATSVKTSFAWMRFCYPWITPFVVFIGFPEVRGALASTCTCCKTNMVDSGRQEMLGSPEGRGSWANDASNIRPSTNGRSFHIPVLLATSGGLRLQIGNRERENDVDKAVDFHDGGFYRDPRVKYDPTRSRYPPPLSPISQISDEDTSSNWDGGIRSDSPEPEDPTQASSKMSPDPAGVRSPSDSSKFRLSLTSRELKMSRSGSTPHSPNSNSPRTPGVTLRLSEPETPPGSIPASESNTPR